MSHGTPSEADVVNTLSALKISPNSKPKAKPKSAPVADSWDEEDISTGSDTETESSNPTKITRSTPSKDSLSPITTTTSKDLPNPPPPTPASPTPFEFPDNTPYGQRSRGSSSGAASPAKRPEKTTAVAGRLIAGALGVRAPKRTEEEREFDKAMREKERKRREEERNREKLEKQKVEDIKRSIWED